MTSHALGWMQAINALQSDPDAKVLCPVNQDDYLQVEVVDFQNIREKYFHCPICKAMTTMRM